MKIFNQGFYNGIKRDTHKIMQQLLNPMCGLVQEIGFIHRGSDDPRLCIAGADLSGVHVLQNKAAPKRGSYHIGGGGIYQDEALIKSLGESIERYSQLIPYFDGVNIKTFKSYQEMISEGNTVLPPSYLQFYSKQQLSRPNFPFQKFEEKSPMNWIRLTSLLEEKKIYIPMQLLFVGYQVNKAAGEPWLNSAVTTGTATHVTRFKALKSAILELIQLDAAMGHWYTEVASYEIILDQRTSVFENLLRKIIPANKTLPRFFLLKNADLKGFVISCLFENYNIPKYAVGLGADTDLISALYKAFLEAVGVLQLAKVVLINDKFNYAQQTKVTPDAIFDLDSNVALYAHGDYANRIRNRFIDSKAIFASELDKDLTGNDQEQLKELISEFIKTKKDLYYIDLTPPEIMPLNLHVMRVWSPQLLSLALPSAVPSAHPRFLDYGSVIHEDPHPYP